MKSIVKWLTIGLAVATATAANAADKVSFVTDFGYLGRHAYYFVALEKGYYKEAGLDVNIVRGQGSADAVKQVASGSAEFGFADAAAVILGRGNDNIPVKMVSMIYSKAPHAIFALKDSGIKTPKDLEGRRIADAPNSAIPRLFEAYAKAAGIDSAKVKWSVVSSDAIAASLALGRSDAVGYYSISEALLKKSAGNKELVQLKYADAGLDFYSNGIIASEKILQSNPDLVRRFVEATWRGLKDAAANPEEAAKILNKYHSQIDVDVGAAEVRAVASLVDMNAAGAIDEARMQKTVDIVSGAYEMKSKVKAQDVFRSKL
ncbi:putative membrane lipoprotein lipid attachment site [Afipia carboxidovorans OM5]|uniref:Thiamine pyrimidine synthase n=1 Tax=Afipia carboxidovorans (strain ATCC 49405 / DSM 1227 / KCTC 32145 / OM5) TaxID=504832 RepID=B6JJ71_AFIC5|nr:ABC transporter substrate-binding protein [Afipia carboxidovorans]ACI94465.1 putative membrane lipoprotein lipid attachment site [Afipia carboxidovorans OM5]AEI01904.1 ABC transporter substrate-binding protein [Afipia carboxidovorans OM4]AEI05479.1 ABC transporter substrate-binding protein [Afipia carboxidovorans OM5]